MSQLFPSTGISVVADKIGSLRVFYQLESGHVRQSRQLNGVWTNEELTFNPAKGTPLASITYGAGKEIHVYYLDEGSKVQEHRYTEGKGWYPGEIGKLGVMASSLVGLAAIAYGTDALGDGEKGVHIRVYYMNMDTGKVEELANDGNWHKGDMHISDTNLSTRLAAVAYYSDKQTQIRVYYQGRDMTLKEHCHNNKGWFSGVLDSGMVGVRSSLSAAAFSSTQRQVYYRRLDDCLVFIENTGAWGDPKAVQNINRGSRFAVLQRQDGNRLRVYYQDDDGIRELYSDDGGRYWARGELCGGVE